MARKARHFAILFAALLAGCSQGTTPPAGSPSPGTGDSPSTGPTPGQAATTSSAKTLVAFAFEAARNPAYLDADVVALAIEGDPSTWEASGLPATTSLDDLVPTFSVSEGASLLFAGSPLSSGVTRLPCGRPVDLVLKAEDGSEATVHLRVSKLAPRAGNELVSFSVLAPPCASPGAALVECAAAIVRTGSPGNESGSICLFAPALDLSKSRIVAEISPGAHLEAADGRVIDEGGTFAAADGAGLSVVAEDGSRSAYRVVVPALPAASISAVVQPARQGDPSYIEVQVRRKAELEGARILLATPGGGERVLATLSALDGWNVLEDGGSLRLWPQASFVSGLTTPSLVDLAAQSWTGFEPGVAGILSVELRGSPVCVLPSSSGPAPTGSGAWFSASEAEASTICRAGALGLWSGTDEASAAVLQDIAASGTVSASPAGRGTSLIPGCAGLGPADFGEACGCAAASIGLSLSGSANEGRSSAILVCAAGSLSGDASILGLSADLSGIGLDAATPLDQAAGDHELRFTTPTGLAAGRYAIPITAELGLGGAVVRTSHKLSLEVLPPRAVSVGAATISPDLYSTRSATRQVGLAVGTGALWGAAVSRVTADLSPLGGSPDAVLSRAGDGSWTLSASVEGAPRAGALAIAVKAWDDEDGLSAMGQALATAYDAAFAGADMEAPGPADMPAKSGIDSASPFEGSGSFRYAASVAANALVPVSSARFAPTEGATRLVFWFKGSSGGTAPGLRIQLGSGGSYKCYYDLNAIREGSVLVVRPGSGGAYPTAAIDIREWTRVELDLSGLVVSGTAGDSLAGYPMQFRVRAGGVSDWQVDFVHFE